MKKAPEKRTLPTRLTEQSKRTYLASVHYVDRYPMRSFFAILAVILVLIVISNIITKPKPASTESVRQTKTVTAYNIGTAPKITVSAQTKKSGVIQIVALAGGVIDKLNVQEGSTVKQGDQLVSMSSNYSGQNIFSLQRQSAATQYQGALATYPKQKETIERQKELAEKTQDNSDQLRQITAESIDETKDQVSKNEDALKLLDQQLKDFDTAFPNATFQEKAQYLVPIKSQQAQLSESVNRARQTLRTDEYNGDSDKPPAEIAELTKEITKRQLDVQLKQLQISLEVSRLQTAIAQINESMMFPTAPFAGTIQRVFVKEKQQVSPGTPLFVISQVADEDPITAVAYVSADTAKRISRIEPSIIHIGDKISYATAPSFVSTDAVQGTLYAVYFPIPDQYSKDVVSEGFISVDVPIGIADTTMVATYIPLDAVYQTREKSYVFVQKNGTAVSRDVVLGQVFGGSVEVVSGLKNGDTVILSRDIISGDKIQIQ